MSHRFIEELLAELPYEARSGAESVLGRWAGVTIRLPRSPALERRRARRQTIAAALLRAGTPAPEVVLALVTRFGVSRRQAQRIVADMSVTPMSVSAARVSPSPPETRT